MPRPQALAILEESHRAIAELLASLTDEEMDRRSTIGDGDWSAKDLAVHIALWEELAVRTIEQFGRGERPQILDISGEDAVDRVNEEERQRHGSHPPKGARARFEGVYGRLVMAIDEVSDDEWASPVIGAEGDRKTLGDVVGGALSGEEQFDHAGEHVDDLRSYVASLRTNS